jgi:hypothetical protein
MTESSLRSETKIEDALLSLAASDPQARVSVLVRTVEAAEPRRAEAEEAGLVVRRVLRLVPTLAVYGPVADVLALAERDWVQSLSLDREVRTMSHAANGERRTQE